MIIVIYIYMEINEIILLFLCGLISGAINTIAGGGSLITLPILIFMGLPPTIANGTNRVQLIFQNISAVYGFKTKGISYFKFSSWLSFSSIIGAIIRHGPHQGAQKSTNTGTDDLRTTSSQEESFTAPAPAIGSEYQNFILKNTK